MTNEQRQNLETLARYLMEGRSPHQFDMRVVYENRSCGTVACALGHAPLALGVSRPEFWWMKFWWMTFSSNLLGLEWMVRDFQWCFASDWGRVDNTPRGAGQRILWFLRHGRPDDWDLQMCGHAPLCYTHLTLDPAPQPLTAETPEHNPALVAV